MDGLILCNCLNVLFSGFVARFLFLHVFQIKINITNTFCVFMVPTRAWGTLTEFCSTVREFCGTRSKRGAWMIVRAVNYNWQLKTLHNETTLSAFCLSFVALGGNWKNLGRQKHFLRRAKLRDEEVNDIWYKKLFVQVCLLSKDIIRA